jgi:hypothetical protein
MFDWILLTRCCVGCSGALRDRSSGTATPDRTRDGRTTVRSQAHPLRNGTADWHGPLRDSARGRWFRRAN